jgi:hypothetical protein
MSGPRRYRFGPLEHRGVVGTLRVGQVLVLGAAAILAIVALYMGGGELGAVAAIGILAGAGAAISLPIEGRTLDEWAPVGLRWALRGREERTGFRSKLPWRGKLLDSEESADELSLPKALAGLRMLEAPYGNDTVGVIWDRRAGTYTAAIAVRAGAFGLADTVEQEQKLAAWGSVLASLARDGSPVSRLQWVERTLPAEGDELAAHLQAERDQSVPLDSGLVTSYIELIESAAPATREHEILVALQISERRGSREVRRLGGGPLAGCELLLREAEALAQKLSEAEVTVFGLLRPGRYAQSIRDAFDPFGRQARNRSALADPGREGVDPAQMGPLADKSGWSHYRTDSAYHRTYWISSWPKTDVGPTFLAPLLMQSNVLRTVSVCIEPVPYSTALRRAESARTAEVAEEIKRERDGALTTARVRRRQQAAALREEELADGHAEMRVVGWVTASAAGLEELHRNGPAVEHAAQLARLELQPLYGEQAAAFPNVLPLCGGMR